MVDTVEGSSSFQAIISSKEYTFPASKRICVCEKGLIDFGSCDQFTKYCLYDHPLNKVYLRSNDHEVAGPENDDEEDSVIDFLSIESFLVIAAEKISVDTVWFLKVIENDLVPAQVTKSWLQASSS